MHYFRLASVFAFAALLPACATIVEGTGQSVSIDTNPPGATCAVDRKDQHLGTVAPTPGSVRVDKSKNDLTVTCTKPGYAAATATHTPHFVGTTFGNLLLGGIAGFIVDASTGANYTYPDQLKVDMAPVAPSVGPATLSTGPARPNAAAS